MAKKKTTVEKTKMKSNKWKNGNENARRLTRASESKPNTDGFRSTLTISSKRTSPRSIKTILPQTKGEKLRSTKDGSGGGGSSSKKKDKKASKKLAMTSVSQPSSRAVSSPPTTPTKSNAPKINSSTTTTHSSTKNNLPTTPSKNSSLSKKLRLSTPTKDNHSTTTTTPPTSCVSVNSPTSKQNNKPVKKAYVVFVGNLPYRVTKEQLEEHFRKTGGVKAVRLPKEKGSDKGRGFAYIEFKDRISHKIGLRLHHTHLGGRQINVEFTSIGGKNPRRLEKLKEKNLKLSKMKKEFSYPS